MIPNNLYPRKVVGYILSWIKDPQILLLIGSRQVGKTSILHLLIEKLLKMGIPNQRIHFFDLTTPYYLEKLNSSVSKIIDILKSKDADLSEKNYVFIDEIQYLNDPTTFLKLIADHYPCLKIIAAGSSTLDIRQKFKDALTGRKKVFEIHPLDFCEFLTFKEQKALAKSIDENSIKNTILNAAPPDLDKLEYLTARIEPFFNEYTILGAYPRVALETNYQKKQELLLEIYNSYIRRDIKDLVHIENINGFNNLIKALALQIGQLVNYNELTITLRVARNTLEKYIFLLENTFITKMLPPYFTNKRKEIVKMSKAFFYDTGLRNIVLNDFRELSRRTDAPILWENSVFSQLSKNNDPLIKINFWRNLAKAEVDYVISKDYTIPIEVKFRPFKEPVIPSGLKSFISKYNPETAVVVTKDYLSSAIYKNTKIWFIPPWLI